MFTGDAEEPAENSMLVSSVTSLKCDILKVGHHGSYTATSQTFLDIADPTYAIISAGFDNKYDHPHNQTLEKLNTKNVTTYCTIESGTIIIQTNQNTITVPQQPNTNSARNAPKPDCANVYNNTNRSSRLQKKN